jgi:hypothetical protein
MLLKCIIVAQWTFDAMGPSARTLLPSSLSHSSDLMKMFDRDASCWLRTRQVSAGEVGTAAQGPVDRFATKRGRPMPDITLNDCAQLVQRQLPLMAPRIDPRSDMARYHMLPPSCLQPPNWRSIECTRHRITTVYDLMREPEGPCTFEYTVHGGEAVPRRACSSPALLISKTMHTSAPSCAAPPVVDIVADPAHHLTGIGRSHEANSSAARERLPRQLKGCAAARLAWHANASNRVRPTA